MGKVVPTLEFKDGSSGVQKQILDNEQALEQFVHLLKTYFQKGGLQIQISVLDHKAMIEAQKRPEDYKDLIVRIGGYSEYFNKLEKELQDTVIQRTAHGL